MIKITVDPAGLTKEQRDAVAGFILAYPDVSGPVDVPSVNTTISQHTHHGKVPLPVPASETGGPGMNEVVKRAADRVRQTVENFVSGGVVNNGETATRLSAAVANELQVLADEADAPASPAQAFGITPAMDGVALAAATFGAPVVPPLTFGATSAPASAFATSAPVVDIAPTGPTLGLVSLTAPASPGVDFSAALAADAQKLAALGQSGAAILPNGVELDAAGLPWDTRINPESRAKIANGTWRKRPKLDAAFVATVEAELRAVMGAPTVAAQAPTPNPTHAQPGAPVTTLTAGHASLVAPAIAPPPPANGAGTSTMAAPSVAPAPPPAPLAPPVTAAPPDAMAKFVGLIGRSAAAMAAQKLTQAQVTQVCTDFGIGALPLLGNRLDLVEAVAFAIDSLIAAKG